MLMTRVFPARAGMSPFVGAVKLFIGGVPRASGDEPTTRGNVQAIPLCSPRERG